MMTQKQKSKASESFKTKLDSYLYIKGRDKDLTNTSLQGFSNFELTEKIAMEYASIYWQQEGSYRIQKDSPTIKEIEDAIEEWKTKNKVIIKEWRQDYINRFESIFPKEKFENMLLAETCSYCKTSITEFDLLRKNGLLFKKQLTRGWDTLEIDRKSPNLEYTPDNTVMCCYWCNNAKTDEFSAEEFKIIAKGFRQVYEERIQKIAE